MNIPEIESALKTLTLLCDTREHDTPELHKRLKEVGLPVERKKLNFGDYSAKFFDAEGMEHDMSIHFSIERKMSLDELAQCYTRDRDRFKREFERARSVGAKIYLLVENGDYERMLAGRYRSKLNPEAYKASVFAWMARYNCVYVPCKPDTTPKVIREICFRETKEYLVNLNDTFGHTGD
jgi:ERCC4-type nuclease